MSLPGKGAGYFLLAVIVLASIAFQLASGDRRMLAVSAAILGMLTFFSILAGVLKMRGARSASEIRDRTVTWWWMAAVFMLAMSTHKIAVLTLMGLISFLAMREYFGLMPSEKAAKTGPAPADQWPKWLCYSAVPLAGYLAYIRWYGLFIILIPVYYFLLIPVIFVLQNRTTGTIRSLGTLAIGLMFFGFNLGHGMFMANMGAMVILYCFFLTEVRDLLSYWVGKGLAICGEKMPDSPLFFVLNLKVADRVSPKKTWGAGVIVALMLALLSAGFAPLLPDFPRGRMETGFALLAGFLIGLLGMMGDLVFSMIKRDIGTKDSGSILPGHGGIIDRVDSLVLTVPITFHLVYWQYF